MRQTSCSGAQKWNGFTRCSSICNIFQQISSFVSMCQHSSCTVFTQDRAKPSKCIVCKFCLVPLQLLLGTGREVSAVAVLQVLSSQFKHCKSYCTEHAYKTVPAVCPVQSCLLLSWVRWESKGGRTSSAGQAKQSVKVARTEAEDVVYSLNELTPYIPHILFGVTNVRFKKMTTTDAKCKPEDHLL